MDHWDIWTYGTITSGVGVWAYTPPPVWFQEVQDVDPFPNRNKI